MKKILLLYANPMEARYIHFQNKICIGMGATNLPKEIENVELIILFGCSGALNRKLPLNRLYISYGLDDPMIQWTGNKLVHSKDIADTFRTIQDAILVEWESKIIYEWCRSKGLKYISIRYITDYCEYKCKPVGINHFWRIYQHWRMQRRFNKILGMIYHE